MLDLSQLSQVVIYQLTCLFTYKLNKIQLISLLTHHKTTKIQRKPLFFLPSFLLLIYFFVYSYIQSWNDIGAYGVYGAKYLGIGIAQCKYITTLMLDLSMNEIGDEGVKDLGTGIAQCKNITTLKLDLCFNKIGDDSAKDLSIGIAQCKNITTLTLDLFWNYIGEQEDLGTGIAQCQNITTLTLIR
ncbi:kinase domain protein (macronuclear) [Tetrahymena thermophila SB210]|uniref:Kinase domain protein n=1 Tax=Tetrahymena thermophila (strain SB210) TaxID=312017 RepID=Q22WV8_TETTS|nr:kinase domain protein [Tetrahymena thermophila SB210]EAR89755.2 kinase domain protein [Tetrahymena thermophila SB210]|eukprot:XP_001010000.2 kinase domain protein [Tetrahymena thermophila SB210]